MTRRIPSTWLSFSIALGALALGCETGGVGDPCIPEDEYQQTFTGYSEDEVNVESRSFQCETRVCLVNHFRGRVSCPYGQTAGDLALPGNDPKRCRIPGTTGENPQDQIGVVVNPQLTKRRADDSVYCSCRCANAKGGKDDGARYCDCPSGFTCEKLLDDLGLGSSQLAGSYCIRDNTKFDPTIVGSSCVPGSTPNDGEFYCGGEGKNPF